MPKIKTNKSVVRKFKINAAGKVLRKQAFKSHNTAKKTPKRVRQLRGLVATFKGDARKVKKVLPYA
ncbi:MAG: 50S ribosomal protein L35 [Bdellovibrionota bacterium]